MRCEKRLSEGGCGRCTTIRADGAAAGGGSRSTGRVARPEGDAGSDGRRQVDLVGPVFPSASAASDFLAGRRPLSYERVRKLATFFHVSPAVFFSRPGEESEGNVKG